MTIHTIEGRAYANFDNDGYSIEMISQLCGVGLINLYNYLCVSEISTALRPVLKVLFTLSSGVMPAL